MASFLKEHEIRPENLFQTYLDLATEDIKEFFADASREPMACPACDSVGELAFEKLGFAYRECQWEDPITRSRLFESF